MPAILRRLLALLTAAAALAACDLTFDASRPQTPIAEGSTVVPLLEWDQTRERTLNIVFVPDTSYGDMGNQANRQAFFDDLEEMIERGYWQNNAYYRNLGKFNYYYLTVAGSAAAPTSGICPNVTWPAQADTDAGFADLVLLVHRNELRDCRWGRKATTEPTSFNTIVHESSHALFNLPDEYCCDGGYRVLAPVLYNSQASCTGDAANAAWRNCVSFTGAGDRGTWWRSEDSTVDVMSAGGATVLEAGQADWAVMRSVLDALGGGSTTPTVFAPAAWDRPE